MLHLGGQLLLPYNPKLTRRFFGEQDLARLFLLRECKHGVNKNKKKG